MIMFPVACEFLLHWLRRALAHLLLQICKQEKKWAKKQINEVESLEQTTKVKLELRTCVVVKIRHKMASCISGNTNIQLTQRARHSIAVHSQIKLERHLRTVNGRNRWRFHTLNLRTHFNFFLYALLNTTSKLGSC
eukprot:m.82067 g.82067  ORF g.82067 m.82067 type:complete len:136 (-) comp14280_c1_seq1:1787-2194(-)